MYADSNNPYVQSSAAAAGNPHLPPQMWQAAQQPQPMYPYVPQGVSDTLPSQQRDTSSPVSRTSSSIPASRGVPSYPVISQASLDKAPKQQQVPMFPDIQLNKDTARPILAAPPVAVTQPQEQARPGKLALLVWADNPSVAKRSVPCLACSSPLDLPCVCQHAASTELLCVLRTHFSIKPGPDAIAAPVLRPSAPSPAQVGSSACSASSPPSPLRPCPAWPPWPHWEQHSPCRANAWCGRPVRPPTPSGAASAPWPCCCSLVSWLLLATTSSSGLHAHSTWATTPGEQACAVKLLGCAWELC